jgi:hypothetical protein
MHVNFQAVGLGKLIALIVGVIFLVLFVSGRVDLITFGGIGGLSVAILLL